ncbi:MAG: IS4 family transposase [Candidatus Marinimicrobia bacterium]|jgi:hypothetical protein|nr:IS4 family transposase [Candidatus Neomarinimicrobiota bacterium]
MPTNHLYHTLIQRIRELHPNQRITRIKGLASLMIGIYKSRSVYLSRIAGKLPGQAKLLSTARRMARLLDNPAIRVREWYEPIARQWLNAQFVTLGEIRLLVDGTKVGFAHQLLMVSLAYRRRSVPIAWTWIKHVRGHSTGHKQLALLAYVRTLIPSTATVFLVGDTEFGPVKVLKELDCWHWYYVLRQKSNTSVWLNAESGWNAFGSYIQRSGQSFWLEKAYLTRSEIYQVHLIVHWKVGEKEPWCLATNIPDKAIALRFYKRRMWIEEMFGDMKKHGFDLECSMLHTFLRLSRLTLAVAILYVWMIATGTRIIHQGQRHLVDRKDRRDLSIFQIGLRFIERRITNELFAPVSLCSYR